MILIKFNKFMYPYYMGRYLDNEQAANKSSLGSGKWK